MAWRRGRHENVAGSTIDTNHVGSDSVPEDVAS